MGLAPTRMPPSALLRGGMPHLLAPELATAVQLGKLPVAPQPAAEVFHVRVEQSPVRARALRRAEVFQELAALGLPEPERDLTALDIAPPA
jgi:hypothetical protein